MSDKKTMKIKIKPTTEKIPSFKINDKKYSKIFHISDIHIRPDERLDEYEEVFQKLYDFLDTQDSNDDSLLVITGDIYYSKNVFKPSSNYVLTKFFSECAKRIEVVLITGNHDMNEQNLDQIDALTPLVAFSPIHYLRDTGLYQFGNFVFSVSSLTDAKFIKYSMIDKTKYTTDTKFIKLYHGMLKGAVGDNGLPLKVTISKKTSRHRTPADFKGYDAVLLGDIHKYQFLNKKQTIAYCGSLVQQNHGETLDHHGILVWNMATKKISTTYVELENNYGFVTFEIVKNKLMNPLSKYPKFIYARFFLSESNDYVVNEIEKDITIKGSKIVDKHVKFMDSVLLDDIKVEKNEKDFDDIEVFKDILTKSGYTDTKINAMLDYHNNVKKLTENTSDHLSSVWKPDSIEFRNFFLYGGDHINSVDIRKGVSAIVSPNNTGKTSFVKTALFGLFGEVYNDFGSTIKYINNGTNKKYAYTDVKFSIGKTVMDIRREHENFVKSKKGVKNAKFKHSFKIDESNKTGIHKIDTNKKITHYIGSKDMFVTLNVCSTKMNKNFANFNKKDINQFLQQIFKLDVFEKYEKKALSDKRTFNDKLKTLEGSLSVLEGQIVKNETFDTQLKDFTDTIIDQNAKKEILDKKLKVLCKSRKVKETKHSALCKLVDSECFEHNFEDTQTNYLKLNKIYGGKTSVNNTTLNKKLEKLFKKIVPVVDEAQDEYDESLSNLKELGWKNGDKVHFNLSEFETLSVEKSMCEKENNKLKSELKDLNYKNLMKKKDKLMKKIGDCKLNHETSVSIHKQISDLHGKRSHVGDGTEERLKEIKSFIDDFDDSYGVIIDEDELRNMKNELAVINHKIVQLGVDAENYGEGKSMLDKIEKALTKHKSGTCVETVLVENGKIVVTFGKSFGNSTKGSTCYRKVDVQRVKDVVGWIDSAGLSSRKDKLVDDIKKMEDAIQKKDLLIELESVKKDVMAKKENEKIDLELAKLEKQGEMLTVGNELKDIERKLDKCSEIESAIENGKKKLIKLINDYEIMKNNGKIVENLKTKDLMKEELNKIIKNTLVEKNISVVKKEIRENEKIQEFIELEKLYKKYIDAKDKLDEINVLKNEIDCCDDDINEYRTKLDMIVSTISSLTSTIDDIKQKRDINEEKINKVDEIKKETKLVKEMIDLLSEYKNMVKYDGVPNALIKKKKEDICKFVNSFISDFTDICVDIIDDTVCVQKNDKWFHVGNLGGYESWLISVAFKTALNRFSFYSKSAIMIIDEEVDCVDVTNFDSKLPMIFNKLKQFYYSIILVSHRDVSKLKDWDIIIENKNGNSIIAGVKAAD